MDAQWSVTSGRKLSFLHKNPPRFSDSNVLRVFPEVAVSEYFQFSEANSEITSSNQLRCFYGKN